MFFCKKGRQIGTSSDLQQGWLRGPRARRATWIAWACQPRVNWRGLGAAPREARQSLTPFNRSIVTTVLTTLP